VRFTILTESGRLEFEEFITLAAKFIVEEDAEALEKELREAFRLYDKEGKMKNDKIFVTGMKVIVQLLDLSILRDYDFQ